MDLREQEYVVAMARHGSVSKAAQELFVSQPTLSIFLNRLEERLGIRLFERIGKRLVPTYAGELYIKSAREMLVLQNQFQGALGDLIKGYTGRLRLGLHLRRSSFLLPRVLTEFSRLHPNVEVVLKEDISKVIEEELLDGELDLILTNRFFSREKLEIQTVYNDYLILVVPADHPVCGKGIRLPGHAYPWLDLKLVAGERFILQNPAQSVRTFTDAALAYAGVKPERTFMIENMETAAQMAAEGFGVAFNYESYIRHYQYPKPIRIFEVGFSNFSIPISMAYRKGGYLPAFAADLIELVKEEFNGSRH